MEIGSFCSVVLNLSLLLVGEGEHKIMEFIRRRKMEPDYCPYETHCLHGLDADLIMLALASHEPYFILLREEVDFGKSKFEKEKENEKKNLVFFLSMKYNLFAIIQPYFFIVLSYYCFYNKDFVDNPPPLPSEIGTEISYCKMYYLFERIFVFRDNSSMFMFILRCFSF